MPQFIERKVRGDLDLEDLQNFCITVQNMSICKLIRISKKSDEPPGQKFNLAIFEEVGVNDVVADPVLVALRNDADLAEIIANHLANGKKFVFDAVIFVESKESRVLGFR